MHTLAVPRNVSSVSGAKKKREEGEVFFYRVVKWHANDREQTKMRTVWEGWTNELGNLRSAGLAAVELPLWHRDTGTITEFQKRDIKGEWHPCRDPRPLQTMPSRPSSTIFVIDADRKHWEVYENFFSYPVWRRMFATNLRDAGNCFSSAGLDHASVIVVGHANDNGSNYDLVRTLRTNGFKGRIIGLAEKRRWLNKLKQAGCSEVFFKSEMLAFLRTIHGR
jgi:hypothetical protein